MTIDHPTAAFYSEICKLERRWLKRTISIASRHEDTLIPKTDDVCPVVRGQSREKTRVLFNQPTTRLLAQIF